MACINMYNSEHHNNSMMSPRISFSSDFVIDSSGPSIKHERPQYRPDLSAPDFEFSAGGGSSGSHSMIAADEVFFKGRLLPLKENCARLQKMTLRDELKNEEEKSSGAYVAQSRPSKVPIRWKELLGLRKAPPVPKKQNKSDGSVDREEEINGRTSQEARSDGRSGRHRNLEVGL